MKNEKVYSVMNTSTGQTTLVIAKNEKEATEKGKWIAVKESDLAITRIK